MSELVIRPITRNDIASCLDIYNYEVVNGVATLDLEPRTLSEWQEWYESHSDEHHPIVVGTVDGIVAGYASLSPYRPKEAYKSTVELSIYIHQDYRGRGIATQLMTHILEIAKIIRYCTMWYPLLRLAMKAAPSYTRDLALPIVV